MSGGWNTIESDAGVFTFLLESLGVKNVQFEELISLDADSLRALSPLHGVIFLFKYPTGEKRSETPGDGAFDYDAVENGVWFAAQTIQNACGTQALLSVLLNKDGEDMVIGPSLSDFKDFTAAFPADVRIARLHNYPSARTSQTQLTRWHPPQLRGEALSNSDLIRETHNSFARSSPFVSDETRSASADDDDVYHFIAYTSVNGTLYELDGLQPAPISHGACDPSSFPEKIIPVLRRRIERYPATEIRFNLLAMCQDLRVRAREMGDMEGLEREEAKRREWRWENALRRHNFVGFVGELMKAVTRAKLKDGSYERWVEDAKAKTKKRVEGSRKKGGDGDEMDV
ncbi:hypothetical protein LTR66_010728 [Elasticomyces elasticus]|nr:hypothetical protein LTR66_010728 [Elasticomyces elasticus]